MLVTQNHPDNLLSKTKSTTDHHCNSAPLDAFTHINSSSISSSPDFAKSFPYRYSISDAAPDSTVTPRYSKALPYQQLLGFDDSDSHPILFHDDISLLLDAIGTDLDLDIDQSAWMSSADTPWVPESFPTKPDGRVTHQRDSSLSSLGSAGPDSPYTQNTSNPRFAVTDSGPHGDFHNFGTNYYHSSKPMDQVSGLFYSQSDIDPTNRPLSANLRSRNERGLLPPPDFSIGQPSHTGSVASSVVSDSPATPSLGEPDIEDRRRRQVLIHGAPKLERTMTDIYNDELYSPIVSITSTSTSPVTRAKSSMPNDMFRERVQEVNNQYLSAGHSQQQMVKRERSPFREVSQFSHEFSMPDVPTPHISFGSAGQLRERPSLEQESAMFQQQSMTPQTSPHAILHKEAIVKQDPNHNFQLFSHNNANFDVGGIGGQVNTPYPPREYQYMTQIATTILVPQQYPFVAEPRPEHSDDASGVPRTSTMSIRPSTPPPSTESSRNVLETGGQGAGRGIYSCTYRGCTRRFETQPLLQKHKKEGHRQPHGLSTRRRSVEIAASTSTDNSQAGPHRCDQMNPGTNKPCNIIFSRPYDLTRHEDTIHNGKKRKSRCDLCTEERTFSRADALTRHYRVVHPSERNPGRRQRRAE